MAKVGRDMEQPISHSPGGNLPWLIRRHGIVATVVVLAVAYLLTSGLPDELNLLIPYNLGVAVYMALFAVLMKRASPEDAAKLARRGEPDNILTLLVVNALSIASLVGVAAMLNHPSGRPRWVVNLPMTTSLLAVILSWFLSHIYFGLHDMRLYYDDTVVDGKLTYHGGLEFPERETADYWDFHVLLFYHCHVLSDADRDLSSVGWDPQQPIRAQ